MAIAKVTRLGNIRNIAICALLPLVLWCLSAPTGLDPKAWKVFAIFVYAFLGMLLKPLPVGAITLSSLSILALSGLLTFEEAFSGFTNSSVWLIVFAFFIARGFIKTGLGLRIAYHLMRLLGKSTLGMAYGFVFTDFILGSAIPSMTARAGGVIYPIVTSLSEAFGSTAKENPRALGAYLIKTIFQCGAIIGAMFLTAMSGNLIIQNIAMSVGVHVSWSFWALSAFVPGMISLLVIPLLLYKLYPPTIKKTPEAREFALSKLKEIGPITSKEWVMVSVFLLLIVLWGFQFHATNTALFGLLLLLFTNVLNWEDILSEKGAWDTLIWFASLVTLSAALNKFGFMQWFSESVKVHVEGLHWQTGFLAIALLYYYTHYFFASNVAHITAMYAPFLILAIAIGTPPPLAALLLGFFSNLYGALTTYGSGPAPIFFGSGYVPTADWWRLGFIISLFNIAIWVLIGGIWWHFLGLW